MKIGARKKSKSQSRTKHFWVALLLYSEILNSDWLELVMWLATTNHCAFQHTLIASLWNSCLKLAPSFKASYKVPVNLTRDSKIGQHQHQQKLKHSITKPIKQLWSIHWECHQKKVKSKIKRSNREEINLVVKTMCFAYICCYFMPVLGLWDPNPRSYVQETIHESCFRGGRHSSVVSSAPTIRQPWVWIPSTPSTLFQFVSFKL